MGFWRGGGGGGGNTPSYPIGKINKTINKNVKAIQRDAYGTIFPGEIKKLKSGKFGVVDKKGKVLKRFDERKDAKKFVDSRRGRVKKGKPLVDTIKDLSAKAEKKIINQANAIGRDADKSEKQVLNKLKKLEDKLDRRQGKLDDTLEADMQEALGTFEETMALLDETDRAEFEQQVADLRTEASGIEDQLQAESDEIISDFDTRSTEALDEYEDTAATLGDEFQAAVDTATTDFESLMAQAGDLSPERLALFTQAADFLSQAAVDTRMNMLATADPRALELSALADENAAAMMSGRIGADVQANLARSSAMRALQGGFGAGSEMGRGLAARDLGLTSLDLMRQGAQLNESQRRLNFDTRVAGLQADAGQLLVNDQNRLTNQANTLFDAGLRTAESNRNFGETAASRILGGNLALADQVRGDRMGTANTLFGNRMNTANTVFGNSFNNLANRTQRQAGVAQTRLTGESSTAEAIYNRNTENLRQNTSTRANLLGNIYNNQLNESRVTRGMKADAYRTSAVDQMNTAYNVFGAINDARTQGASQKIGALQNNYTESLKRAGEQNAGIGSLIGMGGSVIGGALGLIATGGNPLGAMAGSTLGGSLAAVGAGQFGYGGSTGGAQGANTGSSMMGFLGGLGNYGGSSSSLFGNRQPSGWNNFDYGSGTGA